MKHTEKHSEKMVDGIKLKYVCNPCPECWAKVQAVEGMAEALKALLRDHAEMEKLEGCVCLKFETEQEARACLSVWKKTGKGEGI